LSDSPNKHLINQLTRELKPVRPMSLRPVIIGALIGCAMAVVYVSLRLGFRPEIKALMAGHWPEVLITMGKPLAFMVTGLSALWAMGGMFRPDGELKTYRLWPVFGLIGLMAIGIVIEGITLGGAEMVTRLGDPIIVCFTTILGGGAVGFAVLWGLWLRHAAPSNPTLFGALSGLMCASFMASAYAMHCDRDAPIYILTYYGLAVAAFTGIGALVTRRFLRW
jgi:hypothetical protein